MSAEADNTPVLQDTSAPAVVKKRKIFEIVLASCSPLFLGIGFVTGRQRKYRYYIFPFAMLCTFAITVFPMILIEQPGLMWIIVQALSAVIVWGVAGAAFVQLQRRATKRLDTSIANQASAEQASEEQSKGGVNGAEPTN